MTETAADTATTDDEDPAAVDPAAVDPAPAAAPAPPEWYAMRLVTPDGAEHFKLCMTVAELTDALADIARVGDLGQVTVLAADPDGLAMLRHGATPAEPATPVVQGGPTITKGSLEGQITAEDAAQWGNIEWSQHLRKGLLTAEDAARELSRVEGRTLGIHDIKGRPDRAAVVLAWVTGQTRPR